MSLNLLNLLIQSVILCDLATEERVDIFTDRRKRYLKEDFLNFSKKLEVTLNILVQICIAHI